MTENKVSRRSILRRVAGAAVAAAAAPSIVPARALGLAGEVPPSSRIGVGMIGTGRQVFFSNLPWFLGSKEVQVTAVCDVDSWRLERAKKTVEDTYAATAPGGAYKGCLAFRDFRDLLARKDVDAVMISTPDHWHAFVAVEAARAGKDIALEKPISLSVPEGRAICDAVKKHGRIFRTDTEVRAEESFHRICQTARSGRLGKITRVLAGVPKDPPPLAEVPPPMPVPPELDYPMWLGSAPEKPYTMQRVHFPKGGLDYGGNNPGWMHVRDTSLGVILNWGTHIIDIVGWGLGTERTGPVEVEGKGRFGTGLWDILQEFEVRYRYSSGVEVLYSNAGRAFVRFEGTDGWIEHTWFQADGLKASREDLLRWSPGAGDPKLPRLSEKQDFIDCVKSRKETLIPAEVGHRTATLCQIGHIAAQLGRKLTWNPEAERFSGDDEANALLPRPQRAPWRV
jgi:myo-inositol 2-dehydrogenase / D-chiro-inositol 1-dehydrogenase